MQMMASVDFSNPIPLITRTSPIRFGLEKA